MMIDTEERDYEKDSKISENCNLAKEWRENPAILLYWSKKHALAITMTNRGREKLRVVKGEVKRDIDRERAKVDLDIRKHPGDYGLQKNPSEAAIVHAINSDPEFLEFCDEQEKRLKEVNEDLIDLIEQENVYENAVKAMQARKRSLEHLQSLWEKNYHGNRVVQGDQDRLRESFRDGDDLRGQMRRGQNHD